MIDLDAVHFAYEDEPVLDGVSLEVCNGEVVGLIGPNGAGKTTLLRLVAGYLTPAAGTIAIDGDDVVDLGAKATSRRVAVVPQATDLSFDFPVREVVAMGRHPHRGRFERSTRNDRERVEVALAATATASLADRSFATISGGERKRVLLARALAQGASNLLLDEPTASLDLNHQVAVFDLVDGLRTDDHAVLAAIHDLDLAARYCDRLALLHEGRVVAVGPPREVLQPSVLEAAYGIRTAVLTNPVTGTPTVVPDPPRQRAAPPSVADDR
ncbi:MAG: heme ABC transporter ATP-binding protein [Halobacteriales archaeon]